MAYACRFVNGTNITITGDGSDTNPYIINSSGGSSAPLTVDTPPASPNAADYEFDATSASLPAGWSWVNQGAATYAEGSGAGMISAPAKTSYNWRALVRNVPAGSSWTATVKLSCSGVLGTDGYDMSLLLRESSSGKLQEIDHYVHANLAVMGFYVNRWTNPTTYGSSPNGGTSSQGRFNTTLFFRITKNSATSWDFAVSPDGLGWLNLLTAHDLSAYMTPDQIGFGADLNTNVAYTVACHWFRVT